MDPADSKPPKGKKRKVTMLRSSQEHVIVGRPDGGRQRHNHHQQREEVFDASHWGHDDGDFQSRIERLRRCWVRDLTADGDVEGNPGWGSQDTPSVGTSYAGSVGRRPEGPKGEEKQKKKLCKQATAAAQLALGNQVKNAVALAQGSSDASAAIMKDKLVLDRLDDISQAGFKTLKLMIETNADKSQLLNTIHDIHSQRNAVSCDEKYDTFKLATPSEDDHHEEIKTTLEKSREIFFHEPVPVTPRRQRLLWVLFSLAILLIVLTPDGGISDLLARTTPMGIVYAIKHTGLATFLRSQAAYFSLCVAAVTIMYHLLFSEAVRKHVYHSTLTDSGESVDLRPDALSLGKLLHRRQYKATVEYRCLNASVLGTGLDYVSDFWIVRRLVGLPEKIKCACSAAVEVLHDLEWVLCTVPHIGLLAPAWSLLRGCFRMVGKWAETESLATWRLRAAKKTFVVSLELLAQLCTPHVLRRGAKPEWVTRRIQETAQGVHSIAINRFGAYEGEHIIQRTMEFAFAVWADMERDGEMLPFPTSPVA